MWETNKDSQRIISICLRARAFQRNITKVKMELLRVIDFQRETSAVH